MSLSSVPDVYGLTTESEENEVTREDVERAEKVFDRWVAENSVSKDVKHVMPVIRKRKGVDNRVEVDNRQGHTCGRCEPEEGVQSR